MIQIKDTERYNINPMELIGDAFETAYTRYAEEQPVAPPDPAMPVFTGISTVSYTHLTLPTKLEV